MLNQNNYPSIDFLSISAGVDAMIFHILFKDEYTRTEAKDYEALKKLIKGFEFGGYKLQIYLVYKSALIVSITPA